LPRQFPKYFCLSTYKNNWLIKEFGMKVIRLFMELALIALCLCVLSCPSAQVPTPTPTPSPTSTDVTAPTGSIVINNSDIYTTQADVTLTLTVVDESGTTGLKMKISNSSDFFGADWESFSASRAWTLSPANGNKTIYVRFSDAAENQSIVYTDSISLDDSLPGALPAPDLAASDDSGFSNSDNITNIVTGLTLSGNGAEGGGAVRVFETGNIVLGNATADELGFWSLDVDLAEGSHTLYVRAIDGASNMSPSSAPLVIVVDQTGPSSIPSIRKPLQGANTGINHRPVFSWTEATGAFAYELQADDSQAFANVEYIWSNLISTTYSPEIDMATKTSIPVGTRYYLRVRALDAAGNAGPWSNQGQLRYVNVGRADQDFNGDGFSDVIMGDAGKGIISFGRYLLSDNLDVQVDPTVFVEDIAFAGDMNGDGFCDAIAGDRRYHSNLGGAAVFLGGASMDANVDFYFTAEFALSDFGLCVSSAGDVNCDGFSDVIVGALSYDGGRGRAYIYYGNTVLVDLPGKILTGTDSVGNFGSNLSGIGDHNGDGFDDVLVTARWGASNRGTVSLFLGGASMDQVADVLFSGEFPSNEFGHSITDTIDFNGDGLAEIVISSPSFGSVRGKAYLYFGKVVLSDTPDITILGEGDGDIFGKSISSAGDVDNDGLDDLLIGAWRSGEADFGGAYMFFGNAENEILRKKFIPATGSVQANLGFTVSGAGDMNKDGYSDFILGGPLHNIDYDGRVYVYLGGDSLSGVASAFYTGNSGGGLGTETLD
jgi:hypothetical protein